MKHYPYDHVLHGAIILLIFTALGLMAINAGSPV